jgi:hypothetical protein
MEKAKFPLPPTPVLVVIEVMLALPDTFAMVPYAHPEVVLSFPAVRRWNRHVPVMSEGRNVPPRFWATIIAGPPVPSVNVATITLMSLDTTQLKVLSPGFKSIPDMDMV